MSFAMVAAAAGVVFMNSSVVAEASSTGSNSRSGLLSSKSKKPVKTQVKEIPGATSSPPSPHSEYEAAGQAVSTHADVKALLGRYFGGTVTTTDGAKLGAQIQSNGEVKYEGVADSSSFTPAWFQPW